MKRFVNVLFVLAIILGSMSLTAFAGEDIIGDIPSDPKFDLIIKSPDECSAGDLVVVEVSVENITQSGGISAVEFVFNYDNTKLTLLNRPNPSEDNAMDCIKVAPDGWENISTASVDKDLNYLNDGEIRVAIVSFENSGITENGKLVFEFRFLAKDNIDGVIELYIPHKSVSGVLNIPNSYLQFSGKGDYFEIKNGASTGLKPSESDLSNPAVDVSEDNASSQNGSSGASNPKSEADSATAVGGADSSAEKSGKGLVIGIVVAVVAIAAAGTVAIIVLRKKKK